MEVTLAPTLSSLQKGLLRDWLIEVLNDPELNSSMSFPLSGYLSIYVDKRPFDKRPLRLQTGTWIVTSETIYLAKPDADHPKSERLPILLTLSQLCEPSEELTKACSGAITRYLLGEYRSLSSNLVVSTVSPSGIAFSCDNRVASLLGNEWVLPSGETVDVSGPDWVVCASEMPVRVEPVVDVEFNAAPFGPAFPPTQVESPTRQFTVGDRVSYTRIPGVHITEPETGVVEIVRPDEGTLIIRSDRSGEFWHFGQNLDLLTFIEPPIDSEYQFSVGQRVHWTPPPEDARDGIEECDALIVDRPNEEDAPYYIREDNGNTWWARTEELRAI